MVTAMRKNEIPPIDFIAQCFDVVDGDLFWKERPLEHFDSQRAKNMWNAKFAGKRAGRKMQGRNYRQVAISGIRYLEHRILAVFYGISTKNVIDHIDGNGLNNRVENLRAASHQENSRNSVGKRGKRLRVGVYQKGNKFGCSIRIGDKQKWLGVFDTEAEAVAARKGAENLFFGEFAVKEERLLNSSQAGNDEL